MKTIAPILILITGIVLGISGASIYYKVKAFETNSKIFAAGAKEALED